MFLIFTKVEQTNGVNSISLDPSSFYLLCHSQCGLDTVGYKTATTVRDVTVNRRRGTDFFWYVALVEEKERKGGGREKRRKRKEKNKEDEEGEEGSGDGRRKENRCSPPYLSSYLITRLPLNYREWNYHV